MTLTRQATTTLRALLESPMTLDQLRLRYGHYCRLSECIQRKMAEHIPGPSPCFYKITEEGRRFLATLSVSETKRTKPNEQTHQ